MEKCNVIKQINKHIIPQKWKADESYSERKKVNKDLVLLPNITSFTKDTN